MQRRCSRLLWKKKSLTVESDLWKSLGFSSFTIRMWEKMFQGKIQKVDYGQQEAEAVFGKDPRMYQTTVSEFKKDEAGKVCGVKIIHTMQQYDAETNRVEMIPVEGTEEVLPADLVLIAAGFQGCETYIPESFSVKIDERTNIKTDPKSYKTNVDHVLTAGDMHRGQSLVVWAIAEGRNAAKEVDESLMGYTNL